MSAGELPDPRANRAGAGEADFVDEPLLQCLLQTAERRVAFGMDDVEYAVGQAATPDEQLEERLGRGGGVLCRLPDRTSAVGRQIRAWSMAFPQVRLLRGSSEGGFV